MHTATLADFNAELGSRSSSSVVDEQDEWQSFSRAIPGREGWWESGLAIDGMHCAGCAITVEKALGSVRGVESVHVNGAAATARLVWCANVARPSQWLGALAKAGYSGVPAGDMAAVAQRKRDQRLLLWRWLVAGFCMMQVMMYAVPGYMAAPGEIAPDIQSLLRWASWVLTLPVMLFSCSPFFGNALRDLRNRRAGMDVTVSLGILIAFAASTVATFDPAGVLGEHDHFAGSA